MQARPQAGQVPQLTDGTRPRECLRLLLEALQYQGGHVRSVASDPSLLRRSTHKCPVWRGPARQGKTLSMGLPGARWGYVTRNCTTAVQLGRRSRGTCARGTPAKALPSRHGFRQSDLLGRSLTYPPFSGTPSADPTSSSRRPAHLSSCGGCGPLRSASQVLSQSRRGA
jgi:hypothetical protein